MKKLLSVLALTSFLAGCTAVDNYVSGTPYFTKDKLVGKWKCTSAYQSIGENAEFDDIYHINFDGTATNEGVMTAKHSVELKYKYLMKGKWNLNGWYFMQYQTEPPKVERIHPKETLEALKTNKELQDLDKKYYEKITKQSTTENRITYLDGIRLRTTNESCDRAY